MGLLTIIKKQKLKDQEIRCLVLGLDNSGKTTIVNQLLPPSQQSNKITPTIGFQIRTISLDDTGKNVSLWDVGGQTTLRPFWDNYFDKTDILIWCIDISMPIRFDESFKELKELVMRDEGRIGYECKVIIACNKVDLINKGEYDDILNSIRSNVFTNLGIPDPLDHIKEDRMRESSVLFLTCSGVTGEGIDQLKNELVIDTVAR